jgi:hypothetical protein
MQDNAINLVEDNDHKSDQDKTLEIKNHPALVYRIDNNSTGFCYSSSQARLTAQQQADAAYQTALMSSTKFIDATAQQQADAAYKQAINGQKAAIAIANGNPVKR